MNRYTWSPQYQPEVQGTGRYSVKRGETAQHEIREPQWPYGGVVTRPIGERYFEVQEFTGYPVSNQPQGQWVRGQIIRQYQVNIHPPMLGYYHYDPTDPLTWHQSQV